MTRRASLILHGVLFGVGGLILTMPVYYLIGSLLHGHRSSWSTGMGDGFVAFLFALYAVPLMAILWAGAGVAIGLFRSRPAPGRGSSIAVFFGALILWIALGFGVQLVMV